MDQHEWDELSARIRAIHEELGPPHVCRRECVHTLDFYRLRNYHRRLRAAIRGEGPMPDPLPPAYDYQVIYEQEKAILRRIQLRQEAWRKDRRTGETE